MIPRMAVSIKTMMLKVHCLFPIEAPINVDVMTDGILANVEMIRKRTGFIGVRGIK
jgi:hypothetical protein